jgi:uncharacterized protein YdiU (UPF0061 family)
MPTRSLVASDARGGFEISYAKLPEAFHARVTPTSVRDPRLVKTNVGLARDLGLSPDVLASPTGVAVLAGNRAFEGIDPIATAYAGHQFGNWVPSLGDGRAIVIGEVRDREGKQRELQLKGAGPTPFSRGGDGRAAMGPVLREYVLSEAMHALGIPTTRALAMVTTGEPVLRERAEPGAILTRVSPGFVRVGSFEYFHRRGMTEHVGALVDHVIGRHYPEAAEAREPVRDLLDRVVESQAELIARWLLVGFIHGVMNTDNMSILGETIDYGPCAFLDDYEPDKVFSSIDRQGRYAYSQQPRIGLWNLTRFAETLIPLLADEEERAVDSAREALERYAPLFDRAYQEGLRRKIGLLSSSHSSRELASDLLEAMAKNRADFTLTFRRLSELRVDEPEGDREVRKLFDDPAAFDAWARRWRARLREEGRDDQTRREAMRATNPLFIPRNHRVQQAIDALVNEQDSGPLEDLVQVTSRPYEEDPERAAYAAAPEPHEVVQRTFCGT